MTTHSLLCTKCGYSISGESREELFSEPRSCPQCYSTSWDIIEGEPFPCKENERKIIYQKILHILKWCANEKACQSPDTKPAAKTLSEWRCVLGFCRVDKGG